MQQTLKENAKIGNSISLKGVKLSKNQHWRKCNPSQWGVGLFKGNDWNTKIGKLETYWK
jgi:hypothetical protein